MKEISFPLSPQKYTQSCYDLDWDQSPKNCAIKRGGEDFEITIYDSLLKWGNTFFSSGKSFMTYTPSFRHKRAIGKTSRMVWEKWVIFVPCPHCPNVTWYAISKIEFSAVCCFKGPCFVGVLGLEFPRTGPQDERNWIFLFIFTHLLNELASSRLKMVELRAFWKTQCCP